MFLFLADRNFGSKKSKQLVMDKYMDRNLRYSRGGLATLYSKIGFSWVRDDAGGGELSCSDSLSMLW